MLRIIQILENVANVFDNFCFDYVLLRIQMIHFNVDFSIHL